MFKKVKSRFLITLKHAFLSSLQQPFRYSYGLHEVRETVKELRMLQLYLTWVNGVHCYIIFAWKISCIGITVLSGYGAIAHFNEHKIFGAMFYSLFVDILVFYCLMYDKAFVIPGLFEETKINLRKRLMLDNRPSSTRRVYERQLRSIL